MPNGFNASPFVLPNMFAPPGDSLNNTLNRQEREKERQYDIDWRNQRQQEADDWRKLNLIQDLTNLDKYQTGEATADALGYQKSNEMLQRFTAMASSMSPQELQYKISQEMGNTAGAMKSLKDELVMSDSAIKQIKELYPDLDVERATKTYRADVINRRIQNGEFKNPTLVEQSRINFNDPETIADFMAQDSDKIISKEILNPQIYQTEHRARGNRDSYSKFTEKLSPFAKSNLKPEDYNADMMLKSDKKPEVSFDSVPEDIFGIKIDALSPEAYKAGFSPQANVAFISIAKKNMPQWSKMSSDDKDKAIRGVALEYVKKLDKSGYSFDNANPPAARTNNTINMPGSGGGAGVTGNVLNTLEVGTNQADGNYGMVGKGNKKNLADLQILLGEEILPASAIASDDKEYEISYEVKGGNIESVTVKGIRYDRDFFQRRQEALDKEPKWSGKLKYPTEQRRIGGSTPKPTEQYSFNGVSGTYQQLIDAFGSKEKVDAAIKDGRIKKQ